MAPALVACALIAALLFGVYMGSHAALLRVVTHHGQQPIGRWQSYGVQLAATLLTGLSFILVFSVIIVILSVAVHHCPPSCR
jgi:hypothetical protein